MNKVMAEYIKIGVIGEAEVEETLGFGAEDLIFSVISATNPSEVKELRVPANNVVVGKK